MTGNGWLQLGLYMAVLLLLAKPLGGYMARVYEGEPVFLDRLLRPVERLIYRVLRVSPQAEMGWKTYALAMLLFNAFGFLAVYGIQRLQGLLPLNPQPARALAALGVEPHLGEEGEQQALESFDPEAAHPGHGPVAVAREVLRRRRRDRGLWRFVG